MLCDPSLRDEIISILSPHADGCQDVDCEWCDGAIYRADLIAKAVVEHLARPFDELAEKARGADRNNRDVDAALAWDTAARIIRGHGVGAVSRQDPPPADELVETETGDIEVNEPHNWLSGHPACMTGICHHPGDES